MSIRTVWQGPAVLKHVHDLLANRLDAAAIHLQNQIKAEISLPGTGGAAMAHDRLEWRTLANGRRIQVKLRYRKRQTIYGLVRSKPGEPPRKQTGHLRRSYTHVTDRKELVAYVGTAVRYGLFLELGTSRMAARPHVRATLYRELPVLKEMIVAGNVPGTVNVPTWAEPAF